MSVPHLRCTGTKMEHHKNNYLFTNNYKLGLNNQYDSSEADLELEF